MAWIKMLSIISGEKESVRSQGMKAIVWTSPILKSPFSLSRTLDWIAPIILKETSVTLWSLNFLRYLMCHLSFSRLVRRQGWLGSLNEEMRRILRKIVICTQRWVTNTNIKKSCLKSLSMTYSIMCLLMPSMRRKWSCGATFWQRKRANQQVLKTERESPRRVPSPGTIHSPPRSSRSIYKPIVLKQILMNQ